MRLASPVYLLFLLSCMAFMPNDNPLAEKIMASLRTHYRNYPQEKTYLQTDKLVYSSGQTIWFKIYASVYGEPEMLSKTVYVQLVGMDGKIIVQNKYPLSLGQAGGDIRLPDRLQSNPYQLRCLTAWMLNFDDSSVFHKTLYIKNILDGTGIDSPRDRSDTAGFVPPGSGNAVSFTRQYQVQFFPEGGELIDNDTGNVAFKANDQYGSPADVQGEIRDENQTLINTFSSWHDGMGKFMLCPLPRHAYTALIRFPDHSLQHVLLPPAKPFGIGIKTIGQTIDSVNILLDSHEARAGQYREVVIAAFQNTGKMATYPIQLGKGIHPFSLSRRGFGTGILRLTVFDNNGLPQAERLVFLEDNAPLRLLLLPDTLSFSPKAKSSFALQIHSAEVQGVEAQGVEDRSSDWKTDPMNLSVSVTDADEISEDPLSDNIYSSMLLTSELKGTVYNPGYYFSSGPIDMKTGNSLKIANNPKTNDNPKIADSVKEALDLVMMTNGWRHFEWKQILNNEPVTLRYPVEDTPWIAGRVMDYKPGRSLKHPLKMIIRQGDSTRFLGYISPDSNGGFILKDYNIPGLSTVYVEQPDNKKSGRKNGKSNNCFGIKYFTSPLDSMITAIYMPDYSETGYNEAANQGNFNTRMTGLMAGVWKEEKAAS